MAEANHNNTIYLGLCMAGAVSAGAYTAGVMDYLIEALQAWEDRRDPKHPEHHLAPTHKVEIPVIGGASAGGMTALIAAAAMNNPIEPVQRLNGDLMAEQPQNKFYHSWVDLTHKDIFPRMLETSDIEKAKIYSLLNASFIDDIAKKAIKADTDSWINRPYFSTKLKVFVTLSNLEGFSYPISFTSNGDTPGKYIVKRHSDFACFELSNNGQEVEYGGSGWTPLCFKSNTNIELARSAAMATGAFPVGLRSRKVSRIKNHVSENEWFRLGRQAYTPVNDPYDTLNVDGGLINNEPFERIQKLLSDLCDQENDEKGQEENTKERFCNSILMIDPFPGSESKFDQKDQLFNIMGHTFSAMIGQLRIKPDHVVDALDEIKMGQFLIAPKRKVPQTATEELKDEHGEKAIACGSLGGFGGFLHKEFRIHDFFLGRANCEQFLRHYFTVPDSNGNQSDADQQKSDRYDFSIIHQGYKGVSDKSKFKGKNGLQIIPIFTQQKSSYYMPTFSSGDQWPLRNRKDITRFKPAIAKRIDKLIMNMADLTYKDNFLLWGGKVLFLKPKLTKLTMQSILKNLRDHQLVK